MNELVWVSAMLAGSDLILMVNTDIDRRNTELAIEAGKLLKAGKPLPWDMCPKTIWIDVDRKPVARMPDLFVAQSYVIVSDKSAHILRQFDLGEGALYPVEVLQNEGGTPVQGDYFTWVFGNTKQAVL